MNTHPTHTQVGGWGLWPMIVLSVGFFIVVVVVYVCLLLLYACVFWVLLLLHACIFVMWLCIVGFVCVCGVSFFIS